MASFRNHGITRGERAIPLSEQGSTYSSVMHKVNEPKLTCVGVSVDHVQKERDESEDKERYMKRSIETTVRHSVKEDELETRKYFFISANYFTKTLISGVYIPAEISVSEFSLKEGITRTYHTFTNPGSGAYGQYYDTLHHADNTHKLPLPPEAMGETNMRKVFDEILKFIFDEKKGGFPPLYTTKDTIHIVESILDYLQNGSNIGIKLNVFSIHYLFFVMKCAACEVGELTKPISHYLTDTEFDRDFYEYHTGLACEYHEEIDRAKYCTLSCVTRWGYTFADMCKDIAIPLVAGRHIPLSCNISAQDDSQLSRGNIDQREIMNERREALFAMYSPHWRKRIFQSTDNRHNSASNPVPETKIPDPETMRQKRETLFAMYSPRWRKRIFQEPIDYRKSDSNSGTSGKPHLNSTSTKERHINVTKSTPLYDRLNPRPSTSWWNTNVDNNPLDCTTSSSFPKRFDVNETKNLLEKLDSKFLVYPKRRETVLEGPKSSLECRTTTSSQKSVGDTSTTKAEHDNITATVNPRNYTPLTGEKPSKAIPLLIDDGGVGKRRAQEPNGIPLVGRGRGRGRGYFLASSSLGSVGGPGQSNHSS